MTTCFLCFQVIDPTTQSLFLDDDKPPRKLRISTLCELLSSLTRKKVPPQFEEDERCEFCPLCAPVISEMEQIRHQMALLEEQIELKLYKIREMLADSGSSGENGADKISKLRKTLLKFTDSEKNDDDDQQEDNFWQDDELVKVEVEQDEENLPTGEDHPIFDFYPAASPVEQDINEETTDPLKIEGDDDDDDEFGFCITPHLQTGERRSPPKSMAPRTKRKRSASPPWKKQFESKSRKVQKSGSAQHEETRRSSRQTKKKPSPVLSDEDIKSEEDTKSDEDTNSDQDWVPSPENDDSPPPSPKNNLTPYKCTFCAKSFATESSLSIHIAITRDHTIPCYVSTCSSTFDSKLAMRTHLRHAHPGVSPYNCPLCAKKFKKTYDLAIHMVVRHEDGEKKFPCGKCAKSFALLENYNRHVKLHEVEKIKPAVCDVCDSRFEDEERLQRHKETHNPRRLECETCGLFCSSRYMLKRHIRLRHTGEKPEKCDQCEESFIDKYSLRRHVARVHTCTRDHVCHICGLAFRLAMDLRKHTYKKHDESKKPVCEICGEEFVEAGSLKSHRIREHGDDPWVCDECGAKFLTSGGLRQHKFGHTGEKPYKCDICNFAFSKKWDLKQHVLIHSRQRSFPCPQCGVEFKQARSVAIHIRRAHTPAIRLPCPHCEKTYPHKYKLDVHIRQVHTGERPFVCGQPGCGKGFAKNPSLTEHLKGCHGIVLPRKRRRKVPHSQGDGTGEQIE